MNSLDEPAPIRSRSMLPRFGLRSLLIFGLAFCLLFGFLGRNLVRIRREDAAIETLKQAGATIYIKSDDGWDYHPATPLFADTDWELALSIASRLVGWSGDTVVIRVEITSDSSDAEHVREALATLGRHPELEGLALAGPLIDDASLKVLSNLPNLESLALARTSVTAEGLAGLPSPRHIHILALHRQDITADASEGVGALEELTWLRVSDASLNPTDLSTIASLPKLETLNLHDVAASESDSYAILTNAKRLRNLSLLSCDVDYDVVVSLASLTQLESLAVDGINDNGLKMLDSLSRLQWLELAPPVTEDAALAFAASHPKCIVKYPMPDGSARYHRGSGELDADAAEDFYAALTAAAVDDGSDP